MKKIVLLALMAAVSVPGIAQKKKPRAAADVAPAAPAARKSLALGAKIPMAERVLSSPDGRNANLAQQVQAHGLVVMFSCNTCPYVIKAQPHTQDLMTQAKALGFGMVVLNSNEAMRNGEDSPPRMKEYGDAQRYSVPYLVDERSELADAFGATRTPEVFLFDGKGKLVYKGAIEDNPSAPEQSTNMYLLNAMHAVVDGKPVSPAETKSIGCGIKRLDM